MTYSPQIDDYVKWSHRNVEGWIYFKSKKYITIEISVRPKDDINYKCCPLHANERVLMICYQEQWKELEFVKSRKKSYEEEKNCMEMVG